MIIIVCSPSWVEDINMEILRSQRLLLRFVNLFEVQMSHRYFILINQQVKIVWQSHYTSF